MPDLNSPAWPVFAGIDWGGENHELCVVAPDGKRLLETRVSHDVAGLHQLDQHLNGFGSQLGDSFASRVLIGRRLDREVVAEARSATEALRRSALDLFADFDVLISAGATSPAPRFDDLDAPVAGVRRTWLDVTARTMAPWSLLGFPSCRCLRAHLRTASLSRYSSSQRPVETRSC